MRHPTNANGMDVWRREHECIRIDLYDWDDEHLNYEVWYGDESLNLWQPVAFVQMWADAIEAATREARRRA
jgi:hypothetical protein